MIEIIKRNIRKEIRDRQKKTSDVCKMLGKSRNFINTLTDSSGIIKIQTISKAIGCNISDLFKGL